MKELSHLSTVLGVGIDIVETDRIRKSLERHGARMLNRLFTEKEQNYCLKHSDPIPHLAGRFCAKEAIVKALGTGFGEHSSWKDLEIVNDANGKPEVILSDWLKQNLASPRILISISHTHTMVTAIAIWTTDTKKD